MTTALEERIASEVMALVGPLRANKYLDIAALERLRNTLDEVGILFKHSDVVPRVAVGWFYFAFSSMLTEASYASDRKRIDEAAWSYLESLEKVLGPSFDG